MGRQRRGGRTQQTPVPDDLGGRPRFVQQNQTRHRSFAHGRPTMSTRGGPTLSDPRGHSSHGIERFSTVPASRVTSSIVREVKGATRSFMKALNWS